MPEIIHTLGRSYDIDLPGLSDVQDMGPLPVIGLLPPKSGIDVLAMTCGVYEGIHPAVGHSQQRLTAQAAIDLGPENLWIIPAERRLPYPYGTLYAVAKMLECEKQTGRQADWFYWQDDDVEVPANTLRILRGAADPEKRPIMAAVGYDRQTPFQPAVWEYKMCGEVETRRQWTDMPSGGVYEVGCTGFCAILIHRSVFDKLPEPWFAVLPPQAGIKSRGRAAINPDTWFSQRCRHHGIPLHVCCDVEITHHGNAMPVNRRTAPGLRKLFPPPMASPAVVPVAYDAGAWESAADTDALCALYGRQGWTGSRLRNLRLIQTASKDRGAETVLDVGCFVGMYSEAIEAGRSYLGVDVTPKFIEAAKARCPQHKFVVSDVRQGLPGIDNHDLVFCFGLLIHVDNPATVIRNLWAATGKTLLLEATTDDIEEDWKATQNPDPRFIHRIYSRRYIAQLLKELHGASVVETSDAPTYEGLTSTLWRVDKV